jgi:hypothetical protein
VPATRRRSNVCVLLRAGKRHRGRRRGPRRPRFRLMTFLSLASRTGRSRRGTSRRRLMGRPCRVLPRALSRRMFLGSLDSSHRVEVHFVNAPPGMRSGLTKSEGPAEVSVRTQYSMDGLS